MDEVFENGVVLFESAADEEELFVACRVDDEARLHIVQESAGPLTQWSFEESPHRVETVVGSEALQALVTLFRLDHPGQVPALLRVAYTGYDCAHKIRRLLKRLEVPYTVIEPAVVR